MIKLLNILKELKIQPHVPQIDGILSIYNNDIKWIDIPELPLTTYSDWFVNEKENRCIYSSINIESNSYKESIKILKTKNIPYKLIDSKSETLLNSSRYNLIIPLENINIIGKRDISENPNEINELKITDNINLILHHTKYDNYLLKIKYINNHVYKFEFEKIEKKWMFDVLGSSGYFLDTGYYNKDKIDKILINHLREKNINFKIVHFEYDDLILIPEDQIDVIEDSENFNNIYELKIQPDYIPLEAVLHIGRRGGTDLIEIVDKHLKGYRFWHIDEENGYIYDNFIIDDKLVTNLFSYLDSLNISYSHYDTNSFTYVLIPLDYIKIIKTTKF